MSTETWKRENTKICQIRLTKSTDIYRAFSSAVNTEGIAEGAYIRQALIEKLTRDGYLKAGEPD